MKPNVVYPFYFLSIYYKDVLVVNEDDMDSHLDDDFSVRIG